MLRVFRWLQARRPLKKWILVVLWRLDMINALEKDGIEVTDPNWLFSPIDDD